MKKISYTKMADTIIAQRKELKLTQAQLAEMTGINRGMISRIEGLDYIPSIDQLHAIAEALHFEVIDLFEEIRPEDDNWFFIDSIILLLPVLVMSVFPSPPFAQHNHVTAVDIIPEKVDLINNRKSPIQDVLIERYLAKKSLILLLHLMEKKHTKMPILSSSQLQLIMTVKRTSLTVRQSKL